MNQDKDVSMILFDLDGTLWDATEPVAEAWNRGIEEETGMAGTLSSDDIKRVMGMTMVQIADDFFPEVPKNERVELAAKCQKHVNEYIRGGASKFWPGVEETLQNLLDAGCRMAVISNSQRDYVKAFIESKNMHKYFVDYEEWERTGLEKSDNIRLVMERNGAERAVYVGDTQPDADAAHKARIPCIYASYGFGCITDAEAEISSFDQLPEVLMKFGFMNK